MGSEKKSALQTEKKRRFKKKGLQVGSFLLSVIEHESYEPVASPPSPYTPATSTAPSILPPLTCWSHFPYNPQTPHSPLQPSWAWASHTSHNTPCNVNSTQPLRSLHQPLSPLAHCKASSPSALLHLEGWETHIYQTLPSFMMITYPSLVTLISLTAPLPEREISNSSETSGTNHVPWLTCISALWRLTAVCRDFAIMVINNFSEF